MVLAIIIIAAIKILSVISDADIKSIIENWVIDRVLHLDIVHKIEGTTIKKREDVMTHQYKLQPNIIPIDMRDRHSFSIYL